MKNYFKLFSLFLGLVLVVFMFGCDNIDFTFPDDPDVDQGIEGYVTFTSDPGYTIQSLDNEEEGLMVRISGQKSEVEALAMQSGLENVRVHVEGTDKIVWTDEDGYFRIDLDTGKYTVAFEHEEFKPFTIEDVYVWPGMMTPVQGANFPLIHYLLIGIDDYALEDNKLKGSISSLDYFNDHIVDKNLFEGTGFTVEDSDATKETIEEGISVIGDAMQERDYFVFYFKGHGWYDGNDEYLCNYVPDGIYPTQFDPEKVISSAELEDWFTDYLPNENVTAVLDSSYSGGFIQALENEEDMQIKASSMDKVAVQLSKAGYTVITAGEVSHEVPGDDLEYADDWKGLLTYSLVKGVLEELDYPADSDESGEITASEWFDYASSEMVNIVPGANPQIWEGNVNPVIYRY